MEEPKLSLSAVLVYAFTVVEPSESSGANLVARPSLTHEQSEEKSDDAGA